MPEEEVCPQKQVSYTQNVDKFACLIQYMVEKLCSVTIYLRTFVYMCIKMWISRVFLDLLAGYPRCIPSLFTIPVCNT
ncbi:hypothetical protein GCM10028868_19790 [Virgibacillus kimchii]